MADKKISQLTAASTPLAGTEVLPIVQSGNTVKVSSDDLTVKNVRSNATTGILQVAGPGAGTTRVMTTPNANFTAARTDAAQTFTGDQTFGTVLGTTFDTNVAAAGVTLAGTTLSADGTDANIDISVTPKGTGSVNITKANIDGGTVDGTVIGGASAAAGTFTAVTGNSVAVSTTQSVISGGMWYQTSGAKLVFTPPSTGGFKWNNYANTVEIASLDNAGKLTIADNLVVGTSGKGIDFSAVTNGPGTVITEILPSYVAGYYTTTMAASTSGTVTLAFNTLAYVKVGRMVTVTGEISVDSVASPVGDISFVLPFTAGPSTAGRMGNADFIVRAYSFAGGLTGSIYGSIVQNSTTCNLAKVEDFVAAGIAGNLQAGTTFVFCFSYIAAS